MKKKIENIIYQSIDELNNFLLDNDQKLEKSLKLIIFGSDSMLDSLSTINFIVILEEKINITFNDDQFSLLDLINKGNISTGFDLVMALENYFDN